jgi:hypothetical protein
MKSIEKDIQMVHRMRLAGFRPSMRAYRIWLMGGIAMTAYAEGIDSLWLLCWGLAFLLFAALIMNGYRRIQRVIAAGYLR